MASGPAHEGRDSSAHHPDPAKAEIGPGLTDEQRKAIQRRFEDPVDKFLAQLKGFVSAGEWTPGDQQRRAIADFEKVMDAATLPVDRAEVGKIRSAVREGGAVYKSARPEFCIALADHFGIAINNILKYQSDKPIQKLPGIAVKTGLSEQVQNASSKVSFSAKLKMSDEEISPHKRGEYQSEFLASLLLAQVALTHAVRYPPLVKMFADRVDNIPAGLRNSLLVDGLNELCEFEDSHTAQAAALLVHVAADGYQQAEQFSDDEPRKLLRSELCRIMNSLPLGSIFEKVVWEI